MQVKGRSDHASYIDLGTLPEQDPVRVDQIHFSIGIEVAQNFRTISVKYAVDYDRVNRGLNEVHNLFGSNIKFLPVERKVLS